MRNKNKRRRRSYRRRYPSFRDIMLYNSYAALRDESYGLIVRLVDETLKDPELRKKIDYYTRQIIKEILKRL